MPGDSVLYRDWVSGGSGRPPLRAGGWVGSVTLHPGLSPWSLTLASVLVPGAVNCRTGPGVPSLSLSLSDSSPCFHTEPLLVTSTGGVTARQPVSQKRVASESPFGLTRDSVPPNVPQICGVVISPSVEVSSSLKCWK